MRNKRYTASIIGRAIVLLALLLGAFSHTAYAQKANTPSGFDERAYTAQYSLPDGTLPVLCDWTGSGEHHIPHAVPCEFCHLTAANIAAIDNSAWQPVFFTEMQVDWHTGDFPAGSSINVEAVKPTRGPPAL